MTRTNQRMAESALGVTAVYTFVAWVYVALCALVAPETLHLPLTHLFAWPHEDTFGVMCFVLSFVFALGWQLLRARRYPPLNADLRAASPDQGLPDRDKCEQ
jgi:hypothetical protein